MSLSGSDISLSGDDPQHAIYMNRCLQLAGLGSGYTAPNPMVGAILVNQGRIIGEGYHENFGGPHAEVNCICSVNKNDEQLISSSTLYVSLEPCAHTGKTPPCVDLIIRKKIPRVVIGCRDPFPDVDGKGIEKLLSSGVDLLHPVLENECLDLNKRFIRFHSFRRPYIILKWARSGNGKIAGGSGERIAISNDYSNRLVHKWRSEEAGLLIGSGTASYDNPQLNTRLWLGKNPVRIIIDRKARLPDSLHIFDRKSPTWIFNFEKESVLENLRYIKLDRDSPFLSQIFSHLYREGILSILVEGGAQILKGFIEAGQWDEARLITNHSLQIENGIESPELTHARMTGNESLFSDNILYYQNEKLPVRI